jgi:hypothetical protein
MGFVQAGFLAAMAAVAVPIIIHLVFGQRARRVDLGTLQFLKIALSQNARRKRLKRWLLLALRIGAISLLAVLFARPFLFALQPKGDDRLVVTLVDRSGSMGLTSTRGRALDLAVDEAKRILSSYGTGTEVKLAFFDRTVHPITGGNDADGSQEASDDWKTPEVCYATTDYGAAMAWARDICVQSTQTHKEVHLLTDLQRCGLGRTPAEPLPRDVQVHVVDFGQPYPRNAAVTRVTPSRNVVRPHEPIAVSATVFNASQFELNKLPVVLHLQHGQRQRNWRSQVSLEPGASDTVEFELRELDEGLWQGYVMVEIDDEMSFDDRRHLALLVAPPIDVLAVDGDPTDSPVTSETYFLEAALRLAPPGEDYPESPYLPRAASCVDSARLPDFGRAAAIVLANVGNLSEADARRLGRFVEAGGGLLIFAGDRVDADFYRRLAAAGIPLGRFVGPRIATELPWRLETWDREHPVFEPFYDPQYGNLQRLAFRCFTEIEPAEGTKVLATFQDGSPALLECGHGRGKVLWFASTSDRDWSDWPRSRLYVPVVHQMLGYLVGLTEGGPIRSRETDEIDPAESPLEPGIYDRGGYHEIVNVDPRESETDRSTIADLASRFRFDPTGEAADADSDVAAAGMLGGELRQDEIWHWALLVLFAVLLVEGFLANRTTV